MDLFGDLPAPKCEGDVHKSEVKSAEAGIKRSLDEPISDTASKKASIQGGHSRIRLRAFCCERKGEREEMQDAHVIIDDFRNQILNCSAELERLCYFAIFDGHGGTRASLFCAKQLHSQLAKLFPKESVLHAEKDLKRCIVDAYKGTDEAFLREATKTKPVWKDGTTAVTLIQVNDTLFSANLGDSKAYLFRYSAEKKRLVALPLTKEHSPTQYEERQRIQKAGGYLKDGRVLGQLEVSRSIGDGSYKAFGVSSVPDVRKVQLTREDRFVLLACDGLWKSLSEEECADIVERSSSSMEAACATLANEAVRKLSGDNVTVMLIECIHE